MRTIGRLLTSLLLVITTAVSCHKEDVTGEVRTPMSFSSEDTKAGIYNTHESFKVWATRVADANTTLMSDYRVNYVGTQWTYTEGTGTDSQTMKYWDTGATSFRFHAGAPYSAVSNMTADGLKLSMTAPVKSEASTVMYSSPKTVLPANYGKTVGMTFNHAYACIDMYFRLATTQTGAAGDLFYIKDIKISPVNKGTFPKAATCDVTYDWAANTASLNYTATTNSASGEAVNIGSAQYRATQTGPSGDLKKPSSIFMIPTIGAAIDWNVSIQFNGVTKVAKLAASDCNWKAGKRYRYNVNVYTDFIMVEIISVEDWVDETIDIVIEGE